MRVSLSLSGAGPNFRKIQWTITDLPEKLIRGFNLLYTEVATVDPKQVNAKLIDGYSYKHILSNYSKFPRGYYVLEVVYCDGSCERTRRFNLFNIYDKQILNIFQRDLWELLFAGVPLNMYFVLFQKRSTGTPCPKCTANYRIGNVQAKCPICLGTGYKSGYYFPTFFGGEFATPFQEVEGNAGIGKQQDVAVTLKTSAVFGYPRFGDMIREMNSPYRLYAISGIIRTDAQNQPMNYQLSLVQVDSHHPLYMVEIPDHSTVFTTPVTYLNIWKDYENALNKFKAEFAKLPQSGIFTENLPTDSDTPGC